MLNVEWHVQTMMDPNGTLIQQAAESLRISEELYRRANETARRLTMQPGEFYVYFKFASQVGSCCFGLERER